MINILDSYISLAMFAKILKYVKFFLTIFAKFQFVSHLRKEANKKEMI